MSVLESSFRDHLASVIGKENEDGGARAVAEVGACAALEALAVHLPAPHPNLDSVAKHLRNQLRAMGRQLGDRRHPDGRHDISRLTEQCAYEHWHRMLFARFLAENDLLIHPRENVPVTLADCVELASSEGADDGWELAGRYASRMLPQIFRPDDALLKVRLAPEHQAQLEQLLSSLPAAVFRADDSLGWVYQFWQARRKKEINESEVKIGANELPAVTQLFTEDYMVLFLLHNTLGAWWAGRFLAEHRALALTAKSEIELRSACALPGVGWEYLRFVKGDDGAWRPAAGTFDGWPATAEAITLLDPSMGSGHFLVFALRILVAFRVHGGLQAGSAVAAVLRDNLFGLEVDPRCTQIAAFNVALAAWRMAGYQELPPLHLACSGLGVNAKEDEWKALGNGSQNLRIALGWLHPMLSNAATLGSLVNPGKSDAAKIVNWDDLSAALRSAVAREGGEDSAEIGVRAFGVARAAEILASRFTLVVTNVPFLGRGKQDEVLQEYCGRIHPEAKADLATCFVERCLDFSTDGGSVAVVTPQNWLFLGSYKQFRQRLLREVTWNFVARLGPKGFQTPMWDFNIGLFTFTRQAPVASQALAGLDVAALVTPNEKASALIGGSVATVNQAAQLGNPDGRVTFDDQRSGVDLLNKYAECYQGIRTGDRDRFVCSFWEVEDFSSTWEPYRNASASSNPTNGITEAIRWERGDGQLHQYARETREKLHDMHESGQRAWGKKGVAINQMSSLRALLFYGEKFDGNVNVIFPEDESLLLAIWAFCSSPEYEKEVRRIDQKLAVTNATLTKVPFDLAHWQKVAADRYPSGLPTPHSDDPRQWLFTGHPCGSEQPLHTAMARLVGFQWPRQRGISFPGCPTLTLDGLDALADDDGIVCIPPVRGELPAADRLTDVLAKAYGKDWHPQLLAQLLAAVGAEGSTLDGWLRDGFFRSHCSLFDQRPFIWQIWDGHREGFSALVNYHRLDHETLKSLTYSYLGEWIRTQEIEVAANKSGAGDKLVKAKILQQHLAAIVEGEAPMDTFIRWKAVERQPIGWHPDLNDGVRLNIRPFMTVPDVGAKGAGVLRSKPNIKWGTDRGKNAAGAPWGEVRDNDRHLTLAEKRAARGLK